MKKWNYYILFIFLVSILIPNVNALTIRETMDSNDDYSTIEDGSIIIGATKFLPDTIITASRAAKAGSDDAMLYVLNNGNPSEYEMPGVYYYVDSYVGWFYLDNDNKSIAVDNEEELDRLSKLDIYYVDNVEKVLEIEYLDNNIDLDSLPKGVTFKDNKLFVNATKSSFEFMTNNQKKVSYVMDLTTSKFIEDIRSCYTVIDGIITDYDSECGNKIVIPTTINNEDIVGIGDNAFKGANLVSVVIPNEIKTLGNNAFAENKLESVIIKDKYDELDFSLYGDNVFGEFNNITYDNELTRILNYVDEDFVIRHYKNFDISFFDDEDYALSGYIAYSLIDIFKNNGYDREYDYCFGECYYEEREIEYIKDVYGVGLILIDELKYQLTLVKYDNNKINKVSKVINVSFLESGVKKDNDIVIEAMNNLQLDERGFFDFGVNITRNKYILDLEDLYDVDIIFARMGGTGNDWTNGEGISDFFTGYGFYIKNGVLYKKVDNFAISGERNTYYPNVSIEDYDNLDDYVDYVLALFSEKIGVKNYDIIKNDDDSLYSVIDSRYETAIAYEIKLIDKDYLEDWTIEFYDFYDDKYNSNGYTNEECFTFNDGVITDYDGTCGVNIIIPGKISDINVEEIDYGVFSGMKIRSIVLPSGLKKIGSSAFSWNNIKELVIPSSVKSVGHSAFSNNKIEKLVISEGVESIESRAFQYNKIIELKLPDSLKNIGDAVFNDNQLLDKDAFIYGRKYDSLNDKYVWDYERIVGYGGKNRDNVVIPDGVKIIEEYAFSSLGIKEINIPYGVEEIGSSAFFYNNLTKISIPDSIVSMGSNVFDTNKFSGDNSFIYTRDKDGKIDYTSLIAYSSSGDKIDELVIPNKVKKIWNNAFSYINVKKLVIPYGVEEIGDYAFGDVDIRELSIPKSVIKLGKKAFDYNYKVDENDGFVYAMNEDGTIDKSILMAYIGYIENGDLTIPEGVVEIGDNVFYNNYNLNEVYLPKSLKKIGDNAFSNIYSLNKVVFNDNLEIIGNYAFYDCNLSNINLNNKLQSIGNYAFANNNITEVNIPSSVINIGDNAFGNNYNLSKIILNEGLEEIGSNAFNFGTYNSISIPSSVKVIGDNAFRKWLSNVEILGKYSLDEFLKLGDNALGISGDTKVIFPKNFVDLNLDLPTLPLTINNYHLNDELSRSFQINDIKYRFENDGDDKVKLILSISGTKVYESYGNDNYSSCSLNLKYTSISDSNISNTIFYYLPGIGVGYELNDYEIEITGLEFDNYKLEILDVYN